MRNLMEDDRKVMKDARNVTIGDNRYWRDQLEQKDKRIAELERELAAFKREKISSDAHTQSSKVPKDLRSSLSTREEKETWMKELEVKDRRIAQLEDEIVSLNNLTKECAEANSQISKPSRKCKDNDGKPKENNESWKQEIEVKNRRIVELEQEMASLENFLRDHADTESLRDLEIIVERKTRRIEELEDTVAEFEEFLKQNPDVKELHDLRSQVTSSNRRVQELERWIQSNGDNRDTRIDQARVIELEEMVTYLEDYVREHNVDVLKRKLQDRECRLDQLQSRIDYLEKELLRSEEKQKEKDVSRKHKSMQERGTTMNSSCSEMDDFYTEQSTNDGNSELRERQQKMKKMEHTISEKDNKIQAYEQQIVESKDEIGRLRKKITSLEKELSEYDDIGVLKEEIRVRDERVQQLEDEIDSLEKAFNDRIDLEQIEELVNVVKEREDNEQRLTKDLEEKNNRIEELSEALRESVVIVSDNERRLKQEEKLRNGAFDKIAKLQQRIASLQTASALKCITCQPLLCKLQKYETKLERLTEERSIQLEDFHQMKREVLKAAVSEKDAHLALLELSGIKTAMQSEQAEKLKADRKRLLERLKKEDEKSIELSVEPSTPDPEGTQELLTRILEISDDEDNTKETAIENNSTPPEVPTTNGNASDYSKKATKASESRGGREQSEDHQQDSR